MRPPDGGPLRREDPAAMHAATAAATEAAVRAVLQSGRWVGGPVVAQLEAALAARFGVAHGVGLNSGTDALVLGLQALGIGPGDEVIVPAVSFFATASAVVLAGATPVVVDVLPDRPLLDPAAVRAAWSPRVRAVVPVHLFGLKPPPLGPLPDGAVVVDDAAQAAGAVPPVGEGIFAALSFYPTKVLAAAGDGGALLTDDRALADRVRALGHHGGAGFPLVAGHIGRNSRLDAVQAAVLQARLPDLDRHLARRRALALRYQAALGSAVLVPESGRPVSVLAMRSPRAAALRQALRDAGIEAAVYYPRPLHEEPAIRAHARLCPCPRAAAFCAEALALPCHAALSAGAVDRVVAVLQEAGA